MLLTILLSLISLFFFLMGVFAAGEKKSPILARLIVMAGSWAIAIAIAYVVKQL